MVAFVLFCFLVRWQPWHSRLHLPLFVLGAPLIGVVFERVRSVLLTVVLLLLAGSSVHFLTGTLRITSSGAGPYSTEHGTEQRVAHAWPAYVGAARHVMSSRCSEVGLLLGGDDREYFVWALLADAGWRGRLEPVFVGNATATLARAPRAPFRPCAIVQNGVVGGAPTAGLTLEGRHYRSVWARDDVQVLVPAAPSRTE